MLSFFVALELLAYLGQLFADFLTCNSPGSFDDPLYINGQSQEMAEFLHHQSHLADVVLGEFDLGQFVFGEQVASR